MSTGSGQPGHRPAVLPQGDTVPSGGQPPGPHGPRPPATPQVVQAGGTRVRVMTGLTTFAGRPYLCGPALTCAAAPEDNLAVHAALYRAAPGAVIVCAAAGTSRTGMLGELLATDAVHRGLAGMVVEGPVRDIGDIDRLGFPVLCTGTAPGRAAKATVISVGKPTVVGGVLVATGDQVIADRDGAVVVPAADWEVVRAEAEAVARREEHIRARLAAGERLADIIGVDLSRISATGPDGA